MSSNGMSAENQLYNYSSSISLHFHPELVFIALAGLTNVILAVFYQVLSINILFSTIPPEEYPVNIFDVCTSNGSRIRPYYTLTETKHFYLFLQ